MIKMGNHGVLQIAEYIIAYAKTTNQGISNLKLQKILYFVQAQFLVSFEKPCFVEPIEAWDFGPVVSEAYHKYKIYGSGNIYEGDLNSITNLQDREIKLIRAVVDRCANFSATQLVNITHRQDPWKDAYGKGNVIKNERIRDFFRR